MSADSIRFKEGAGLQEAGIRGAGTKEHSVAGDWTKSTKGGKQVWRAATREPKPGCVGSPGLAEACDWQPGGLCGALRQVDVEVAGGAGRVRGEEAASGRRRAGRVPRAQPPEHRVSVLATCRP